jgi:hypothetical protein
MPLGRRSKAFVGFLAVLIRLANRSNNDLTYSILTDGFFNRIGRVLHLRCRGRSSGRRPIDAGNANTKQPHRGQFQPVIRNSMRKKL